LKKKFLQKNVKIISLDYHYMNLKESFNKTVLSEGYTPTVFSNKNYM